MANTYSAGIATAYGAAVRGGYTGTYNEWCALMADYATVGESAEQAAQNAAASANAAATSESNAATSEQNAAASESAASAAATDATEARADAQTAAGAASDSADNAASSAQAAAQSASAASTSASAAAGDATAAAGSASAAAQTLTDVNAAGAAQISDIDAEGQRVLASIPADYTELSGEVSDLKSQTTVLTANNLGLIPLTFTLTQNKMIDGTDGVERASNASRYASDAVDVENLTKINLYSAFRGNYGAAFYDDHNAFISGVVAADGYNEQPHLYRLDVPAGAKYFRFTVYVVNMPYTDAYLGIPSTHNDFNDYIVTLNSNNKSAYSLAFTLTQQKMIEGTSGNEYAASTSYYASNQVNVEGLTIISLYSAFVNNYGCAFYDSNGVYISGAVAADGYNQQPYTYDLAVPSTAKYFRFTVCSVKMAASSATLKVPIAQTDIVNSIKAIKNAKVSKDAPITDMPVYIKNNLATKDIGPLSKGYILLSFDDGANTLATGTIPLLIENNVPGSFGLLPQSEIFAAGNESYLATVVDAIENHGCAVAMHGSAQWPTYAESALNAYFANTIALFAEKGLGGTYGAICPGGQGDDTSVLVKALAGGYFGYVFSGNRVDKISYDSVAADGKFNGPRSNRFDLDRCSGVDITSAKAETLVAYAAENHLILCPFWHDNTLNNVNHPEYVTQFNALVAAAKSAGLTFITTADLLAIV